MSARRRARRAPHAATAARQPARTGPATAVRGDARAARPGAGWWLAAAALALPPFLVLPQALDPFRLPQRLATEWLALASLLPLAGALAALPLRRLLAAPAARAALPLLAVALLGLPFARYPAHTRDGLVDLAIGATALVGWSLALAPGALRRLLDVTLVPGVGLALMAILQVHHLWEPVRLARVDSERLALTAFAGNPGDLAALLVLPALVAQARLAAAGPRRWRWALALLPLVYALAVSQTLTALAALVAGSLALWLVRLPRRARLWAVVGGLLAALVLAALPPVQARLRVAREMARRGELNTVLSGRLDGWRVATALLAEHPLAGVGQGGYRPAFGATKLRLAAAGVPFFRGHVNPSFANAHDEYLEVGADLGVPGLLALAWGIVVLLRAGWRARAALDAPARGLLAGGAVALALLALAYFPFRLAPVAFGWLAAMAWVCASASREAAAATDMDAAAPPSDRAARRRPLLLGALLLLLALHTGRAGARLLSSATTRAVQQQMGAATAAGPVPGALVNVALQALDRAHRLDPSAIEPLAFRGDALLVARRSEEADAAYRAALRHEVRPEILFNHGLLLWGTGRTDEAVAELRRAVTLSPMLARQLPPGAAPLVAPEPAPGR